MHLALTAYVLYLLLV